MLKNLQIFLFHNNRVYLVHVSFSTYPDNFEFSPDMQFCFVKINIG